MNEYWRTSPPVHVSVAAYLGYSKGASRNSNASPSEASQHFGEAKPFTPRVPIQGAKEP